MNNTRMDWQTEEIRDQMERKDYVFNTTSWISDDLAPSSRYCTSSVLEIYTYGLLKQS